MSVHSLWPDLPLSAWSETCDTLQLWTQIVGKVRIATTMERSAPGHHGYPRAPDLIRVSAPKAIRAT